MLKGIIVKELFNWFKNCLFFIGLWLINNVVDVINFVLYEFGQFFYVFDLVKVKDNKIVVKVLLKGIKFIIFDEMECEFMGEDFMICNGVGEGMCIVGVFGGIGFGVMENIMDVFLEFVYFNVKWVCCISMGYNLCIDVVKVFEKGSDFNIVVYVLKWAVLLIKELVGGIILSNIIDFYFNLVKLVEVKVSYVYINCLIGIDIFKEKIYSIFEALEMKILVDDGEMFIVVVFINKLDVMWEVDVIEEILCIYGYNEVFIFEQVKIGFNIVFQFDFNLLCDKIGDYLVVNGFNEMMALFLFCLQYYKEIFEGLADNKLVYINNIFIVQFDIMCLDMFFSGFEVILYNQNWQQLCLKLFEFGCIYQYGDNKIDEQQYLSFFMIGECYLEIWLGVCEGDVDYYVLKVFVENIFVCFGLQGYQEIVLWDNSLAFGLEYYCGLQFLVCFGKVNFKLVKVMDICGEVFYVDFSWDNLMKICKKYKLFYEELNKFLSSWRDLALVIDNFVKFSDIVVIVCKVGKKFIKDINFFDVYENEEQFGVGKKFYVVSFIFENFEKMFKDKEMDKVVNKLIVDYEFKFGVMICQ